jgi:hypothetical protein
VGVSSSLHYRTLRVVSNNSSLEKQLTGPYYDPQAVPTTKPLFIVLAEKADWDKQCGDRRIALPSSWQKHQCHKIGPCSTPVVRRSFCVVDNVSKYLEKAVNALLQSSFDSRLGAILEAPRVTIEFKCEYKILGSKISWTLFRNSSKIDFLVSVLSGRIN